MKRLIASAFVISAALAAPAYALGIEATIAATVNDGIITSTDLTQRTRLAILSSGLPDNAEVRAKLTPQVLRGLIDEQLELQEAKRLDLSVTKDEIDKAMDHIASENHIPGDMKTFVASHGASPDALAAQIKGGLLWNKVVQRELRPRVEVGEDEIDAVLDRIRADVGKEEFLVSEIFLPVDNAKDEEQTRQLADNLVQQIRHGANFGAVARQFSQGTGAVQGGDIGWIQQSQLAPELNRALASASPGQISDAIRTANGYHILGVRDRRTVTLGDPDKATMRLMQAFRPYQGIGQAAAMQQAKELRATVKKCANLAGAVNKSFPGWKVQDMGEMNPSKAPPWIIDMVHGVPAGSTAAPVATDKGAVVVFVCSRNEGGEQDREAIMHSLGTEKLELQARRLLRDLRRQAFINIKDEQGS